MNWKWRVHRDQGKGQLKIQRLSMRFKKLGGKNQKKLLTAEGEWNWALNAAKLSEAEWILLNEWLEEEVPILLKESLEEFELNESFLVLILLKSSWKLTVESLTVRSSPWFLKPFKLLFVVVLLLVVIHALSLLLLLLILVVPLLVKLETPTPKVA